MRLVVLAPDVPYPPNRGGRADVWRRILAFKATGHAVMLINLYEPAGPLAPSGEDLAAVDSVVDERFSFPMKRGFWRTMSQLATSWWTPWHAATRIPESAEMADLNQRLDAFSPEALWLDGPWFGVLAKRLVHDRGLPMAYRSHNVEHQYLWSQAAAATRVRDRWAWRAACIGVKRLELRLMSAADVVFDISMDDLSYWKLQGVGRQHWLPPLPEIAVRPTLPQPVVGDVVFLGNLRTPNNVRGVEFLTQSVWPLIHRELPEVRLQIIGSHPLPQVEKWISRTPNCELLANVSEPIAHLLGARVLVNPVLTGSGVQLKTMDMLMSPAPLVTTSQGLKGLPSEAAQAVAVADDPVSFAGAVTRALSQGLSRLQAERRLALNRRFSVGGLAEVLETTGFTAAQAEGSPRSNPAPSSRRP